MHFRHVLSALILVACLTLAIPLASARITVTWNDHTEADHDPVLIGYLIVKDGKKRVVWDPKVTSDDDVPARPSEADEAAYSNQFLAERFVENGGFSNNGFYRGAEGAPSLRDFTS